jgi:hypothetical protein
LENFYGQDLFELRLAEKLRRGQRIRSEQKLPLRRGKTATSKTFLHFSWQNFHSQDLSDLALAEKLRRGRRIRSEQKLPLRRGRIATSKTFLHFSWQKSYVAVEELKGM